MFRKIKMLLDRNLPLNAYLDEHQATECHGEQSMRSGTYAVVGRAANLVTQIGSTIILAHLLEPDDFGLFAMMAAVASVTPVLMDLGTRDAAVQKACLTVGEVNALFWLSVGIGLGLTVLVIACRSVIAAFYQDSRLLNIAVVWTLTFLFSSLSLQHTALLRRAMRFDYIYMLEIVSGLLGATGAIVMAWNGSGYWALVFRPVLTAGLYMIGVWLSCPWIPGRPSPWTEVRSMLTLGAQITVFSITDAIGKSMDRIVLGRLGGAIQVGYYHNASTVYENPLGVFGMSIHTVAIASLSKLRNMPDELRRYWETALSSLTFFAMPVFVILAISGSDVVIVLFGEKWQYAGTLLGVIAIRGPAHVIERSHGWLHVVGGRGDRWVRWGIFSCLIQVAAVACGIPFGAIGIAAASTIAIYLLAVPAVLYSSYPFGIGVGHLARAVGPQFLGAMCAMVAGFVLHTLYLSDTPVLERIALVTLPSMALYLLVTVGLFRVTQPLVLAWSLIRRILPTRLRQMLASAPR